jgi:hypothetical protein
MRVAIQIDPADKAKALALLVRHSPGTALPNRVFIVSQEAVDALRMAGIKFTCLAPDSEGDGLKGAPKGEAS